MSGVKVLKQSLFDEFEVRGYWWIPGSEEELPGTMIRTKEGTTLEIFGNLDDENNPFAQEIVSIEENRITEEELTSEEISLEEDTSKNTDNEISKVIWGFTENGEEITILSYLLTNSRGSMPGFPGESYHIAQFLVGKHIHELKELELESMNIDFTYMSQWLGMHTLHSMPIYEEMKHIGNQLQTRHPDNMNLVLPSIDAILENSGIFNWYSDWFEKADISFTSLFKLTANTLKDFVWYTDKMFSLQKLLTLLTGNSIYVKSVSFKGVEEKEMFLGKERTLKREYKWFYDQIDEVKVKQKISRKDFTIQYPEIIELFPTIVNNWFEKEKNLDVVYDLYTNEFYRTMHLTSTFLNFIQAIEVFHRRSYDGKIIEEETYNNFKKKMREFIEKEGPGELKPKLLGSLEHGNERSLTYRLKALSKDLQPNTKSLLFNSEESFPYHFFKKIIDTRNYLTHYDPKNKDVIETKDRYYAIQILRAFVTVLLFKELGMDEEFILNKLSEDDNLVRNLKKANQVLKK